MLNADTTDTCILPLAKADTRLYFGADEVTSQDEWKYARHKDA